MKIEKNHESREDVAKRNTTPKCKIIIRKDTDKHSVTC